MNRLNDYSQNGIAVGGKFLEELPCCHSGRSLWHRFTPGIEPRLRTGPA